MATGRNLHLEIMPSTLTICLSLMLFAVLGTGWVKGWDMVKAKMPQQLMKFCMAYTAFRMTTILLFAGVYVLFISESIEESKSFVLMIFIMYVVMMALTLIKKH